jgi:hypothetical protein
MENPENLRFSEPFPIYRNIVPGLGAMVYIVA